MAKPQSVIPVERIASRIYLIRGEKVMLDSELAELYGVTTAALNQQVKRNMDRFPEDFAFQLTSKEFGVLISQIVISNSGRGGRRKLPWVFTEQGIAMLSSVLRSRKAAQANVVIMRTYVRFRQMLASNADLARKVEQLDRKVSILYHSFENLMQPDPPKKNRIGYIVPADED